MKYLKLKKTSPEEERKKMKEGTRVASNERRLKIQQGYFFIVMWEKEVPK